jgi:prevent-host-death family protein
MPRKIGAYDARTHWSEIIQGVKRGERFIITHHGEPIAELTPPQAETGQERSREAARQLLAFMAQRTPSEVVIKATISEGRD